MNTFIAQLVYNYFNKLNERLQQFTGHNKNIESLITTYLDEEEETDDTHEDIESSDNSELDNVHAGKGFSDNSILQTNTPIIYAFITKYAPNAIKIGYTVQGAEQRVAQWQKHYKDAKLLGWWTATALNQAMQEIYFMDFSVHNRTRARGYSNLKDKENKFDYDEFIRLAKEDHIENVHVSSEFFMKYKDMNIKDSNEELNTQIIEEIITEIKDDISNGKDVGKLYSIDKTESVKKFYEKDPDDYGNTPLQDQAIQKAIDAMNNGATDLLMAAVMRFGKTHTTYEIIRQKGIKYALVTSAKADVRTAWRDDINHINYIDDFCFIEFDGNYKILVTEKDKTSGKLMQHGLQGNVIEEKRNEGKTVIVFATLQDLSGKFQKVTDKQNDFDNALKLDRTIKNKHDYLFNNPPELIVIDETHYGSHSATNGKAIGLSVSSDEYSETEIKEARKEAKDAELITKKIHAINAKYTLQCSGTPYYILVSGEFADVYKNKEIISNVSFSDMLAARDAWIEENNSKDKEDRVDESKSPYFGIPNIIRFGMNLTSKCRNAIKKAKDFNSSLSELFANDGTKFTHEDAIVELMESIYGANNHKIPGFLDEDKIKRGEIFKHIIMVLPHINDCHLLKELMIKKNIINENERKIIVAVERRTKLNVDGLKMDPEAADSTTLNKTLNELENEGKRSVTLTVNRFLTGVSVPLWDAMFFMKDTKSPQEYDQAIFRLCTRRVVSATDEDGNKTKICRKSNVYLIDFKIDRMYTMMVDSAISQCAAQGQTSAEAVKDVIVKNAEIMKTYSENVYDNNGQHILDKMHKIDPDDLLKKYVTYNRERSIEDSIDLKQFGNFLNNADNLRFLQNFSEGKLNQKKVENGEGTDNMDFGFDAAMNGGNGNPDSGNGTKTGSKSEQKKQLESLQKKFINMLKKILYCCICLDEVPVDIDDFISKCQNDESCKKVCDDFGIDLNDVKNSIGQFKPGEKMQVNMLIYQIGQLLNDDKLKPIQRVSNAISKLGQLDKNEVVTGSDLVNKMLDKLGNRNMSGKSILEVNSKYGEFLIQIYERYGKEVANNVKVVASSGMTKNFIRKVLSILELDEQNLIELEDYNGNGMYDIKDFVDAPNEKILKYNNMKKWDVILANPPYDNGLGDLFLSKMLTLANTICTVQPSTWIFSKNNKRNCIKEIYNICKNMYVNIEPINGKEYFDAQIQGGIAITIFDINKEHKIVYNNHIVDTFSDLHHYSDDKFIVLFKQYIDSLIQIDNLKNHLKYIVGLTGHVLHKSFHEDKSPNENSWCVRVISFSPGKGSDGFYTLISKNGLNDYGQYKDMKNKTIIFGGKKKKFMEYYYTFNNKQDCINFINYIQTDFCRVCLYLVKTNMHIIANGATKNIPWFDFSDPVFSKSPSEIDDYLFAKYIPEVDEETGITRDEIRKHIEELLPDYYSIRNKN